MDKYIGNLNKKVGRTMRKQNLLEDGDKILVALSGGKDSMILLDILAERLRHLPMKIELFAAHIMISNIGYETDTTYLKDFCAERGVEFQIVDFEVDLKTDSRKKECFICSWNRRKALFNLTKELNCNKLAFGHHMDDAVETLFMNMMYHGSISSLPFQFSMFEGRVTVIRPLLEIAEEDLAMYAEKAGYKKELKHCPFEETKRSEIKGVIKSLKEMHPVSKKNIFRSMDNLYPEYLPHWNA